MTVPYTFGTATTSIPLSNLDANFNTPITLGNTSIYLGNTTTTIGNLTLTNATISSGNVTISNISVTTANVTTANVATLSVTGTATIATANITTGNITTGNITTLTSTSITDSGLTSGRVTYAGASGLLSDSSKLTFDTSNLTVGVIGLSANADGATGKLVLRKPNEAVGNNQITRMLDFAPYYPGFDEAVVKASISSGVDTGTQNGQLGFMVSTGGVLSEKMRILANGNVGVGTIDPNAPLAVRGDLGTSVGAVMRLRGTNTTARTTRLQFEDYAGIYSDALIDFKIPTAASAASALFQLGIGGPMITMNSNGAIALTNGDTTATGVGITFPATQSASSNANTLDDYEEGTWTPNQGTGLTVIGTFSSVGVYTKVGRQVTVYGYVSATTSIALAGAGQLCSNLPFTEGDPPYAVATLHNSDNIVGGAFVISTVITGSSTMPAAGNIKFSATYFV